MSYDDEEIIADYLIVNQVTPQTSDLKLVNLARILRRLIFFDKERTELPRP